jgi:hypothetical protein
VYWTGEATWSDDFQFFFARKLPREEVYVTFNYGPILSADGRTVEGVFCPCAETTEKIVGSRRLETLRKLGFQELDTHTIGAACEKVAAALQENPYDIPFAAIYRLITTNDAPTCNRRQASQQTRSCCHRRSTCRTGARRSGRSHP